MAGEIKKILKESIPILFLCTLGGVAAGLILDGMKDQFSMIPGLLILLPAVLGNRGNISGALGSRLASALHLGLIEPHFNWRNTVLKDNFIAAMALNVVMSLALGVIAYESYVLFGMQDQMPASVIDLTLIALIAGTTAGVFLTILSMVLAISTYSRGWDPDNVLAPSLATVGDITTVLCLAIAAKIVVGI